MLCLLVHPTPRTEVGERRSPPAWLQILKRVLPAANPDFDDRIRDIQYWWIEVNEQGQPQREIGFSGNDQAVMAMPLGENCGYWADSQMILEPRDYKRVNQADFENQWSIVETELASSVRRGDA
jgi:hypothetical protein